jgi:hypothetical protein
LTKGKHVVTAAIIDHKSAGGVDSNSFTPESKSMTKFDHGSVDLKCSIDFDSSSRAVPNLGKYSPVLPCQKSSSTANAIVSAQSRAGSLWGMSCNLISCVGGEKVIS